MKLTSKNIEEIIEPKEKENCTSSINQEKKKKQTQAQTKKPMGTGKTRKGDMCIYVHMYIHTYMCTCKEGSQKQDK